MSNEFEDLFDNSVLPETINKSKTVSKEECKNIYEYLKECNPKKILEFGTGAGISCTAFLTMSKWLNIELDFHTWDVKRPKKLMQYADRTKFVFHGDDVTGRETNVLDEHKPDLIFLDAHAYRLLNNIVSLCLERKINFMMHDVSDGNLQTIKASSGDFKNKDTYGAWEPYVFGNLISEDIWTSDYYENDLLTVNCIRDLYGLAIVRFK